MNDGVFRPLSWNNSVTVFLKKLEKQVVNDEQASIQNEKLEDESSPTDWKKLLLQKLSEDKLFGTLQDNYGHHCATEGKVAFGKSYYTTANSTFRCYYC